MRRIQWLHAHASVIPYNAVCDRVVAALLAECNTGMSAMQKIENHQFLREIADNYSILLVDECIRAGNISPVGSQLPEMCRKVLMNETCFAREIRGLKVAFLTCGECEWLATKFGYMCHDTSDLEFDFHHFYSVLFIESNGWIEI